MNDVQASPLSLVDSGQALLGLIAGGILPVALMLGLFHLSVRTVWLQPVLEFPLLGLEMALPIWAAFHLGQWIQEHPRWTYLFAALWATMAIWGAWSLPDAQIFGRVWVFVPILGMVLGLVPPSSQAFRERLRTMLRNPFRWGILAGAVSLAFTMGLANFLPDALTLSFPWRVQLLLSGLLGLFVSLMLLRVLDRRWPVFAMATLIALSFIGASLWRHKLIWRIPLRGTSLLWSFPGGLILGLAADKLLPARNKQTGEEGV